MSNLLHKESKLTSEPGNFFLANFKVSIIGFLISRFFPLKFNSLFMKEMSKSALCITNVEFPIKSKNSSQISENFGFSIKSSLEILQNPHWMPPLFL